MAELRKAIAEHDAPRLGRCAHALRGMVANFGAGVAGGIAEELESSAEAGRLDSAPDLGQRLTRALALLEDHLLEWLRKYREFERSEKVKLNYALRFTCRLRISLSACSQSSFAKPS